MPQVTPYLYYEDAGPALEFLEKAFGFEIVSAFRTPEGRVLTSRVRLGSGVIMVGPGMDRFKTRAVPDPEWASSSTYVYVDDVDAHCKRAREAGARILSEPQQHFGGDRIYAAADPGGHRWTFAQRVKSVGAP
jgi:uncharacterized glyoxalase superfamily protein PhnB